MNVEEAVKKIRPLDADSMTACKARWNQMAKPVHGFGKWEEVFMQIAGIQRTPDVWLEHKTLLIVCTDDKMAERLENGSACCAVLAKSAGVQVVCVNPGLSDADMQIEDALQIGVTAARQCAENGTNILAAGLLGEIDEYVLAVLTGIYLGGAAAALPIVIDGSASIAAAFAAKKRNPLIASYGIPSQLPQKTEGKAVLERLSMSPFLDCNMGTEDGSGAVLLLSLLDRMLLVYREADTCLEAGLPPNQVTGCHA